MDLDLVILSRIQFALTISFHYIYPPLSIGLGVMLVFMEGMWLKTGDAIFHQLSRFWTKIFALTFAFGVATGIVMEFEFGTNWAAYSRFVGDVFGSPLAAEGIFAFFLESGFLAVLLFGWDKVSRKMHFFSTLMVCLGAHFSAVWIVVANSWMQTPTGYKLVGEGIHRRAEITDFWAMVFNPSSMDRIQHVLCGAWQAGAFLVAGVSAWYLLKKQHERFARTGLKLALIVALASSLFQLHSGHSSAKLVAEHQPEKFAAMEGHFRTGPAGLVLFGIVDEKNERVIGPEIPGMLSWMLHGDTKAPVMGLNDVPKADRPPLQMTFQFYHLMIAIGFGLIAVSMLGCFYYWRGTLLQKPWMLWTLVISALGPQIANQAGWFAAEIGRQPWIVWKLMRTSEGVSAVVKAEVVLASLILFTVVYALLFAVFIFLFREKIVHGPDEADLKPTGKLAQA